MNDLSWNKKRIRNKTLLIVEGNHEKDKFLTRILEAFPEINIKSDNIIVYQTNIYVLLAKIKSEYGDDWYDQDINLPLLVSKDFANGEKQDKKDYTNIFLIFDYERHDPNFSEVGILKMQEYFSNAEDVGRLYINYPMIESYMDLDGIIDNNYKNKKASTDVKNGKIYKNSVKDTIISKLVYYPFKVKEILTDRFCVDDIDAKECVRTLLNDTDFGEAINNVKAYLKGHMSENDLKTFINQLKDMIIKYGFMKDGHSYNTYMRYVFSQIAFQNIKKANFIQNGQYEVEEQNLKQTYEKIDEQEVLKQQNITSSSNGGEEVSVLNTSIFILPDYNTGLIF